MATRRCDQCRGRIRGRPFETVTGRHLCERCGVRLQGRTAGLVAGGGMANAISTGGWFARVRRAIGKSDR